MTIFEILLHKQLTLGKRQKITLGQFESMRSQRNKGKNEIILYKAIFPLSYGVFKRFIFPGMLQHVTV